MNDKVYVLCDYFDKISKVDIRVRHKYFVMI